MFHRVIHENWAAIVPIISFVVTAGVFLFVSIRAIRLPKARREHLARIPLDENSNLKSQISTSNQEPTSPAPRPSATSAPLR